MNPKNNEPRTFTIKVEIGNPLIFGKFKKNINLVVAPIAPPKKINKILLNINTIYTKNYGRQRTI